MQVIAIGGLATVTKPKCRAMHKFHYTGRYWATIVASFMPFLPIWQDKVSSQLSKLQGRSLYLQALDHSKVRLDSLSRDSLVVCD